MSFTETAPPSSPSCECCKRSVTCKLTVVETKDRNGMLTSRKNHYWCDWCKNGHREGE